MTSGITRLEIIPIFSPAGSANDLDGTADTVIVRIFDEDGRYGSRDGTSAFPGSS